jgi:hypothetical protein
MVSHYNLCLGMIRDNYVVKEMCFLTPRVEIETKENLPYKRDNSGISLKHD